MYILIYVYIYIHTYILTHTLCSSKVMLHFSFIRQPFHRVSTESREHCGYSRSFCPTHTNPVRLPLYFVQSLSPSSPSSCCSRSFCQDQHPFLGKRHRNRKEHKIKTPKTRGQNSTFISVTQVGGTIKPNRKKKIQAMRVDWCHKEAGGGA